MCLRKIGYIPFCCTSLYLSYIFIISHDFQSSFSCESCRNLSIWESQTYLFSLLFHSHHSQIIERRSILSKFSLPLSVETLQKSCLLQHIFLVAFAQKKKKKSHCRYPIVTFSKKAKILFSSLYFHLIPTFVSTFYFTSFSP